MEDTQQIYRVVEIEVSYKPNRVGEECVRILSSHDTFEIFIDFWNLNLIQYKETFCVMLLSRGRKVLGIHEHSSGGASATIVDIRQILGLALKTNADAIILAHNHPSGNLKPSHEDMDLTLKIKEACNLLGLVLLDHLIINDHTYYSFADEGII